MLGNTRKIASEFSKIFWIHWKKGSRPQSHCCSEINVYQWDVMSDCETLPCEYLYSGGRRHWRLACSWISPGERGRPSPPWSPRPGRGSRCHWRPWLATVLVYVPAVQESWRREGSCWSSASQLSSPSSLYSDCGPQCWHRSLLLFTHGGVPLCPPHVNLANITTSRPRRRLCDEGPVSMSCQ